MILYHGSNLTVEQPILLEYQRFLDFGKGFYLTSNYQQAVKWAKNVTRRSNLGIATVNQYEWNNTIPLNVLTFDVPSDKWLDFVVANRKGIPLFHSYDLVIGPVANDYTLPVIDDYMEGRYTKEEAVRRLEPQKLTDQYAFLTVTALQTLTFIKSETEL